MIKIEHLSKSFNVTKAVDDLTFEVKEGEIVGFLGPNGAGKTTTMRMLSGFISPDAGTIEIQGQLMDGKDPSLREKIGYLPENNPLYKEMLVSEMLHFSCELKHIPSEKRKEVIDFVVKAVHLQDVYYKQIADLSKGFKQRVGMATALLNEPEILILDEPTEGLDPNQRTEMRQLIDSLAKKRTIMISTHVMQEAQAMSNRILIINKGKLIADGSPKELSKMAKQGRELVLEVEGKQVKEAFDGFTPEVKATIFPLEQGKSRIILNWSSDIMLQAEISKLIHTHKWIVWKLTEKEFMLEDIFSQLTKE